MQALLSAVIEARNTLQSKQAADTQGKLIRIASRIAGGAKEHAITLILVIQKGHKEAAGLTMLTNDVFFFVFAILKYFNHFGWSKQPLSYSREM